MSAFLLSKKSIWLMVLLYIITNSLLIAFDQYFLLLLPIVLTLIYLLIFKLDFVFLFIVFCSPFSFNFENLSLGGIGLYFPTEPLLLIFSMVFILKFLLNNSSRKYLKHYQNPITSIILLQLIWILITSFNSESPLISFKFLISRTWFVVPLFFYSIHFFKEGHHRIFQYVWAFILPMSTVVLITLIKHASMGFSEEAGHWIMWPFFKDHTSYGAIIAICIPMVIWLINKQKGYFVKNSLRIILIIFLMGLYFSYTRAAWISVVGATTVYAFFYFKIRFKWIITVASLFLILIAVNYNTISNILQKNNAEHTTESFSERIESMSNVSSDASNLERLNRWNCAVRLFIERPFFGWGPGTYAFVYAPFQDASDLTIISTNFGDGGNAHSEYLGPLSEQGLIGMLLMILLVGLVFTKASLFYVKSKNPFLKSLTLMIILSLCTYFSHGILNNYLDTDKASIPVWTLIALFVAIETYSSKTNLTT